MASIVKSDNLQKVSDASNIIKKCGTTITLGASGDSIALASGATQTGFGRTGTVDWDTSSIKTANFTAVSGNGYFCDTNSVGAFNLTLPASPTAGDIVGIKDYANNFTSANLTVLRNGSAIEGTSVDATMATSGEGATLVYVDGTKGWVVINAGNKADVPTALFVNASGGTESTDGDYKIHTFTSPGNFVVSCGGNPSGSTVLDYLVVAAGGGSGRDNAGGAGAGGLRFFATCLPAPSPASPRNAPAGITATPGTFPITVGGGGAAGNPSGSGPTAPGTRGGPSTFDTITSTGGGGSTGDGQDDFLTQYPGGSGGGRGQGSPAPASGSGNTPPTTPSQGSDGAGPGGNPHGGGGGGGFMACGSATGSPINAGAAGGAGGGFPPSHFGSSNGVACGSFRYFAGGGGGGSGQPAGEPGGAGGVGGGGAGGATNSNPGTVGTANTGGGAGGGSQAGEGAVGGDGIVVIRYKYQ